MIDKRYEIKFVVPNYFVNNMDALINQSMKGFNEIYNPREVSSIYLDTPNFKFANQNLQGFAYRKKFRLRFYNQQKSDVRFEIKSKSGQICFKDIYEIKNSIDFIFSNLNNLKQELFAFNSLLNYQIHQLNPVLLCTYKRKYFSSDCKRFRLTLDSNISFGRITPIINYYEAQKN